MAKVELSVKPGNEMPMEHGEGMKKMEEEHVALIKEALLSLENSDIEGAKMTLQKLLAGEESEIKEEPKEVEEAEESPMMKAAKEYL